MYKEGLFLHMFHYVNVKIKDYQQQYFHSFQFTV